MTTFLVWQFSGSRSNLTASIYFKADLLEKIDLDKENDQLRLLTYQGLHGEVKVAVKHNAVAIVKSNCPEQTCVKTGYVYVSNRSIVCAYNAIYVIVEGGDYSHDIEV